MDLIHLCNIHGLVLVSYDAIKYCKGASVPLYIEHGILKYNFIYDIDMYLFQVLPLLPWTSEFSKINIIMYFGHCFPLSSHIRGHMLSTQMALLFLSVEIPYVSTQKDILGLKFAKTL